MTFPRKQTLSLHFVMAGCEALACLIWLLCIPTDSKNAVLGGYSTSRLLLISILLLITICCTVLVFVSKKQSMQLEKHGNRIITTLPWVKPTITGMAALGLAGGFILLLLPPDRLGDLKYAFARIKPALAWITLVCFQIVIWNAHDYANRNISAFATARDHFVESWKHLRGDWKFIPAFVASGVIGILLAFSIRATVMKVDHILPWLSWGILFFGLFMLLTGLFYNHSFIKAIPYLFTIFLLLGAIYNYRIGRADAQQYRAQLSNLADNGATTLANRYHYSLSVYHVLSKLYPDCRMTVPAGLLREWNFNENYLKEWVPVTAIQEYAYNPVIDAREAAQILDQNPVKLEINTSAGTRYYYFLPDQAQGPSQIMLLYQDQNRFILPISLFNRLFPNRAIDS